MRCSTVVRSSILILAVLVFASLAAFAQYQSGDEGQYQIVSARYGTERHNVDVTARLRELAQSDTRFRMGNSTFGVDPDPGVVKTLRIFARGPRGAVRMFEYREGSTVDGTMFTGWGRANWGNERWNGGWNGGEEGEFRIVSARYGTERRNVDVTDRLRELARENATFRMGNSTFGVDPDHGVVKTLRIYARGPRGQMRMFEYREGSTVDGSMFNGWGRGDWGGERWNGGWNLDDRGGDDDRDHDRDRDRGRDWDRNRTDSGALTIVRAMYGSGRSRVDVTNRLQSMIRDGRLDIRIDNDSMGGDPAPHQHKDLIITYSVGGRGRPNQTSVNEGGRLSIP